MHQPDFSYRGDLIDLLEHRQQSRGRALLYRFLTTGEVEDECQTISFAGLSSKARAIGAMLQELGNVGERALLVYPPGLEFISAFYGCLYGGMVAVPTSLSSLRQSRRVLDRLRAVADDSGARFILTTQRLLETGGGAGLAKVPELADVRVLATDSTPVGLERTWAKPRIAPDSLAYLQYTSGSTGEPKGVMVSHANVLHNLSQISARLQLDRQDVAVGWLPLYHDLGLVAGGLLALDVGYPCTLMSPMAFFQRPMRWMRAICHLRATFTMAPTFAYKLVARRATDEALAALDLRSLRVAVNGGEPIDAQAIRRFCHVFAECGVRPQSFFSSYGLAESTLMVSSVKPHEATPVLWLNRTMLHDGLVVPSAADHPDSRAIASCGYPGDDQEVLAVHPETRRPCPPGTVGEIWVRGPSIAQGYWNRPEQTARTFHARLEGGGPERYLRTEDLGFVADGAVYVTGRLKDLIIVRGQNRYPQDIERTVERCHPAVLAAVAFAVERDREERLILVVEVQTAGADLSAIVTAVVAAVSEEHELHVSSASLVKPWRVPRTTSGKIRRGATRQAFLDHSLIELHRWSEQRVTAVDGPGVDAPDQADHANVLESLIGRIAAVLERPADTLDPETSFSELGLDSLARVEVANAIAGAFHLSISSDTLRQFPTIDGLARALRGRADGAPPARVDDARLPAAAGPGGLPLLLQRFARRSGDLFDRIERSRREGIDYFERPIAELDGAWVAGTDGRRQLMFATYNYLGLLGHPRLASAAQAAILRYGTGTHGVRLLGGTLDLHQHLEARIAQFLGREAAITFSSGFMTNYAVISSLVGPGDWVVGDALNHASIVDGCLASGAVFRGFRHNDMGDLEAILSTAPRDTAVLVVADAVFSLDGDVLDLSGVVQLCKAYGATLMVDEAHSLGVLGANGHGIEEHAGLPGVVDIAMGTLSKAIPAAGGFVAGDRQLVERLRYAARGYIFSAAMPPPVAAAALAAFDVLEDEGHARRTILARHTGRCLSTLRAAGFDTGKSSTPIIPIIVGSDQDAFRLTHHCQEHGLFTLPAVPPAVPPGTSRLRMNVTAAHTDEDIDRALEVLLSSRDLRPKHAGPAMLVGAERPSSLAPQQGG
jgi:8-amino-7-oxononanoate synthase